MILTDEQMRNYFALKLAIVKPAMTVSKALSKMDIAEQFNIGGDRRSDAFKNHERRG